MVKAGWGIPCPVTQEGGKQAVESNGKCRKCCSSTSMESGSGKKTGSNGTRSRNLVFSACAVGGSYLAAD